MVLSSNQQFKLGKSLVFYTDIIKLGQKSLSHNRITVRIIPKSTDLNISMHYTTTHYQIKSNQIKTSLSLSHTHSLQMDYTFSTKRLGFRPMTLEDIPVVTDLLSDYDVSYPCLAFPHPFTKDHASIYIKSIFASQKRGNVIFGITLFSTGELIGSISLTVEAHSNKAELGYWIGKPYWNRGYTSEAAQKMVEIGFEMLDLDKINALAMVSNVASTRVMEKIGMIHEGILPKEMVVFGVVHDLTHYSILREEYRVYRL